MRKARVAFYGFSDVNDGHVIAVKRLTQHFQVQCFEVAETDALDEGAATRIREFNPHILVIGYTDNKLKLYKLLKESIFFLPVVLTAYANDDSSLEAMKKAGITEWQVENTAITNDSFAKKLLRFKQEHIDK